MTTLPGVLAEIAALAGRDAALGIALHHGGDDGWDVPRTIEGAAGRALVGLVGAEAAAAIVGRFGGEALAVPLARRAVVEWLAEQGWSSAKIACRLNITRRTARRYRRHGA